MERPNCSRFCDKTHVFPGFLDFHVSDFQFTPRSGAVNFVKINVFNANHCLPGDHRGPGGGSCRHQLTVFQWKTWPSRRPQGAGGGGYVSKISIFNVKYNDFLNHRRWAEALPQEASGGGYKFKTSVLHGKSCVLIAHRRRAEADRN